ncbi:sulfite exporter TauE/SafE family protein [Candidatus Uabimicrobium amorphum]|nr:sulfite exporter TauE/SafE family protein [Candidatus Uabimicrobium amorphum]
MFSDYISPLFLFLVGIAMAVVNILAGGGSILSIPMLIFFGISPTEANATNRVAILMQNTSALLSFARQGIVVINEAKIMIVPSLCGAFFGAHLGVYIGNEIFKKIFSTVIPIALATMFFKQRNVEVDTMNKPLLMSVFFCVGVYGGFIQAGVGFIIILALTSFTNFDLIRINAIKVTIVFCYTIVAVVIFMINGKIQWTPAILLSCGAVIGGWLGSYINVKLKDVWVKCFILVLGILFSIRLILS